VSEEHLEIVKAIFREWEQGDFSNVDWADPDISYDVPGPDPPARGIEGMNRSWSGWLQSYKNFRISATSIHQEGDTAVVEQAFYGEGRSSGIPVDELVGAIVFNFRDGKVVRIRGYTNLADALADAGIPEPGSR
jgi:ketosteroid isomerase-like protein